MQQDAPSVADLATQVNDTVWIVGEDPATPEDDEELWWWYSLDDGDDYGDECIEADYEFIRRGC